MSIDNTFCNEIKSFADNNKVLCILTLGLAIVGFAIGKLAGRVVSWIRQCCGASKKTNDVARDIINDMSSKNPPANHEIDINDTPERADLKNRLQNKKILVITQGMNGLGDYMCAKKICLYAHEKLGIPMQNIGIACDANQATKEVLRHEGLNFIGHNFEDIQSWEPDVQIFSPVVEGIFKSSFVTPRLPMDNAIPTMAIAEYAFKKPEYLEKEHKNVHAYEFGLKDDSLGYIPNSEIRRWAAIKDSATPLHKLQQLANVPASFQKAILGAPYSKSAVEKFANSSKFYFGYAHHTFESYSFIQAVASMNHMMQDGRDLCFYMMGQGPMPLRDMINTCEQESEKIKKHLSASGIGQIELINGNSPQDKNTIVIDPASTKKIKVVTGNIHSQYVPAMHMASEEESLLTGDQTFSEGVSAEKFPIYELYDHKLELYKQLLHALPEELRSEVSFYRPKEANLTKYNYRLNQEIDPDKLAKFLFRRRTDAKVAQLAKSAMQHIAKTFDFAPRFDKAMLKALDAAKDVVKVKIPKIKLQEPSQLTGKEIPFNSQVYMSWEDILKLRIHDADGHSELTQFSDSHFVSKIVTEGYCLIRTKRQA